MTHRRLAAGFTLVELLIVIIVVAVLAAVVIPRSDPLGVEQVLSAAQAVAGDLAYARSLAVANNSSYRLTFSTSGNRYVLEHSGASAALNTLPATAWRRSEDLPTQQTTVLDEMPHVGAAPKLVAVGAYTNTTATRITQIEFGSMGELTGGKDVVVWLSTLAQQGQGYVPVSINAVTGLATLGQYSGYGPPAALLSGN